MLLPSYFAMLPSALDELKGRHRDVALHPARLTQPPKARRLQCRGLHASRMNTPGVFMFHGKVALVPVLGPIFQRLGAFEQMVGGVSTEELAATVDALVADRQITAVILIFDSTGGVVAGTPECAARLRAAREKTRLVAIADSLCASAAYWLASQCSEVVCTPGGQVGSIGIVVAHVDISEMERKAGLKTTIITSSPFKAEFAPELPLSDAARGELQRMVDYYHRMFVSDISKGRGCDAGKVERTFGEGRLVTAEEARRRGMVDKIETLQQLVSRLASSSGTGTYAASTAAPHNIYPASTAAPPSAARAARAVAVARAKVRAVAIAAEQEVAMARPAELQTIVGYASVFDVLYVAPPDGHLEIIRPGAFSRFVAEVAAGERHVLALIDHDRTRQVASTSDGTLTLREDQHGLLIVARIDETTAASHALLRGLYNAKLAGMSIRNDPSIDEEHFLERRIVDGRLQSVRVITAARCNEVSFVLRGANKATAAIIATEHCRFAPAPWDGYERGTRANSLARLCTLAERIEQR